MLHSNNTVKRASVSTLINQNNSSPRSSTQAATLLAALLAARAAHDTRADLDTLPAGVVHIIIDPVIAGIWVLVGGE